MLHINSFLKKNQQYASTTIVNKEVEQKKYNKTATINTAGLPATQIGPKPGRGRQQTKQALAHSRHPNHPWQHLHTPSFDGA